MKNVDTFSVFYTQNKHKPYEEHIAERNQQSTALKASPGIHSYSETKQLQKQQRKRSSKRYQESQQVSNTPNRFVFLPIAPPLLLEQQPMVRASFVVRLLVGGISPLGEVSVNEQFDDRS
jgi:hypothetical protein